MVGTLAARPVFGEDDRNPPKPNPADPVDYIEWVNKTFGAGVKRNAAKSYKAALEKITPFEGDFGDTLKGPWVDADHPEVAAWLDANKKGLKKFEKATRKKRCYFVLTPAEATGNPRLDGCLMNATLSDFSDFRVAVKALIANGFRAWGRGDQTVLTSNALTVLRAANHISAETTVIERLVNIACRANGYGGIRKALSLSENPQEVAASLLDELDSVDPDSPPFSRCLILERITTWDFCQRLFVPNPTGRGFRWNQAIAKLAFLDGFHALWIEYGATLKLFDEYFDAIEAWSDTPFPDAAHSMDDLDKLGSKQGNAIFNTLAPSLTRARQLDEQIQAERRATRMLLHIFIFHGKNGKYPRSLDDLDAPDLKNLRIDPFSGRDFVYKRHRGDFRLYSLALDLDDDDGRHDPRWRDGDYVFWPVQKTSSAKKR
ncbi:MAG: hypothetical protein IID36_14480 [Planctomycetes bacterium]|nr:hypothetical protein [Planctomycetota bacterium]